MSCSCISYATEFIEVGVSKHVEKEIPFRGCRWFQVRENLIGYRWFHVVRSRNPSLEVSDAIL